MPPTQSGKQNLKGRGARSVQCAMGKGELTPPSKKEGEQGARGRALALSCSPGVGLHDGAHDRMYRCPLYGTASVLALCDVGALLFRGCVNILKPSEGRNPDEPTAVAISAGCDTPGQVAEPTRKDCLYYVVMKRGRKNKRAKC